LKKKKINKHIYSVELRDLAACWKYEYKVWKRISILQIYINIAASYWGCEKLFRSSHRSFSVGVKQYIITI